MISVIIPHLNQAAELGECLHTLAAQTYPADQFEIIVVDNGSKAPPTAIVERFPGARLLIEASPGPGPARNTGVAVARGDMIAFIDADCRAHPDWLATIALELRSRPRGTLLGGDVRIWRDAQKKVTAIEAYESVFAYRFKLYIEKQGFSGTGNLALHRADFEAIGPFAGIAVAEDMDWGRRARAAGFRFAYIPGMIVFHPARRSLAELYAKWDRQTLHYFNMAERKSGWRLRWATRALMICASPLADVATVLRSDRIQGLPARLKAFGVLCAVRIHRARTMLGLLHSDRTIAWNREAPSR